MLSRRKKNMTSDIRLIAFDLDGTLLSPEKKLPDNFFNTVKILREHDIRIVIASGRQFFNIINLFQPVVDDLFFISENGALVFDGLENIRACELPENAFEDVFESASQMPSVLPMMCGAKAAYLRPSDPVLESNAALYYEKRIVSDDPATAAKDDKIVKLAICDGAGDAEKTFSHLLSNPSPSLSLALAGKDWLDVMKRGVNKGEGLSFIAERLGLGAENCMAFGDYMNDLEMLKSVSYGYAMANAHPVVASSARYHAPSNADDGVMQVLRKHFPFLNT